LAAARQFNVASGQLLLNAETFCFLAEIVQLKRVDFSLEIDDRLDLHEILVIYRFLGDLE